MLVNSAFGFETWLFLFGFCHWTESIEGVKCPRLEHLWFNYRSDQHNIGFITQWVACILTMDALGSGAIIPQPSFVMHAYIMTWFNSFSPTQCLLITGWWSGAVDFARLHVKNFWPSWAQVQQIWPPPSTLIGSC